jgi:hypothetical protein
MSRKKAQTVVSPTARARTITIAGKEYTVEFNFLAYMSLEPCGISIVKGFNFGDFEAGQRLAFLFAGLQTHHPDVTFQWLSQTLNAADFDPIYPVVVEACKASFPPVEETPEDPTKPIAN